MLSSFLRAASFSAALSLLLLCGQIALPWLTPFFATQDGPSHLHTASVFESLVFHSKGPYRNVYAIRDGLTTNWGTSCVITVLESLFGKAHTEQLLWSLVIILLYAGVVIVVREFGGSWNAVHPITNFLILPWFVWIGFYNFVLGIGICLPLLAYLSRVSSRMTWREARILWLWFGLLFFVHVMSFFVALFGCVAILLLRYAAARRNRSSEAPRGIAALTLLPVILLFLLFLRGAGSSQLISLDGLSELMRRFPMHAFASSIGPIGEGFYVYTVIGGLILAAAVLSRPKDLLSPGYTAFYLLAACLVLYLLVPNQAFEGDEIKIRFAWIAYLFGACGLYCHRYFSRIAIPTALYVGAFVAIGIGYAYKINIVGTGNAVAECVEVLKSIPAGSSAVRLKFSTGETARYYGYQDSAVEPLFHIESLSAARGRWVSISDYQPLSRLFPVALKPAIADSHRFELWQLEGANEQSAELLLYLDGNLGVPIPYVLLVGDATNPALQHARTSLEKSKNYTLIRTDSRGAFLFLYAKRAGA